MCSLFSFYQNLSGRDIVNFLEHVLADNIARELQHDDDSSIKTRLERAFLMTDIQSKQMGLLTSGSTVAVCLLDKTKIIHAANTGDARIVVASQGNAHPLSFDHRASDPSEVARIQEAGGFVVKNRVMGVLAVARSFGDHGMKDFVICKPHVKTWEKGGDFVIVACDGLFDVLSNQQVVDLVYKWKGSKEDVAKHLCKEAMARGSSDNITVIVSWL
jgi:serine/threonine protein phosphatase PrpC